MGCEGGEGVRMNVVGTGVGWWVVVVVMVGGGRTWKGRGGGGAVAAMQCPNPSDALVRLPTQCRQPDSV